MTDTPKFYAAEAQLIVRRNLLGKVLGTKVVFNIVGRHDGKSIATGFEDPLEAVAVADELNAAARRDEQQA